MIVAAEGGRPERTRVVGVVALAALAAVVATVGVTLIQTRGEHTTVPGAVTKARAGSPPLWLDFGVRSDAEARSLAAAENLYTNGKRPEAETAFARYDSLEAQIGAAFARWPDGTLDTMRQLVAAHPQSSLALLHFGWALYWTGRNADAVAAWLRAAKAEPDSPAAVDAQTALHPSMAPGLPFIVTGVSPPRAVQQLPAAQELAVLARAAARPDANAKLLYGVALWNLKRPVSAERELKAAATLAPHDATARTAAAVAAFTKSNPVRAFAQLGPLTAVFPHAPVVRLHLGLLLIWTGQVAKGEHQLRLAIAQGAKTAYGVQAKALLVRLTSNGTR